MLPRLHLLLLLSQGTVSQPCTGPQPAVVPAHLRKASTVAAPNQLQRALDSGAYFVDVPPLPGGLPWLVPPLCLRSNQTVRFQPGVVILAKQGLFHGVRDALLNAVQTVNTRAPVLLITQGVPGVQPDPLTPRHLDPLGPLQIGKVP
jgi:hypothetical protein